MQKIKQIKKTACQFDALCNKIRLMSKRKKIFKEEASHVKPTLMKVLKSAGLYSLIRKIQVFEVFNKVVGEQIKEVTRALYIKEGKLVISVKDPLWHNELHHLAGDILKKMNSKLDTPVRKISFVQPNYAHLSFAKNKYKK